MKNYYDVPVGSTTPITGEFIKVPRDIATGLNPDGTELKAADKGYPLPPTNGSWQLENRIASVAPGPGIDGPQWVLEYWSQIEQRLRLRPRRGHRLRQAAGHGERRLHRRLGARPNGRAGTRHAVPIDERPCLEDGARPEQPEDRDLAHGARRGRRQPGSRRRARSTSRTTSSRRRPGSS